MLARLFSMRDSHTVDYASFVQIAWRLYSVTKSVCPI